VKKLSDEQLKNQRIKLKKNAQNAGKKFKDFRKAKKRAKRPSKNI